jgi:hypothetical protein
MSFDNRIDALSAVESGHRQHHGARQAPVLFGGQHRQCLAASVLDVEVDELVLRKLRDRHILYLLFW